MTPPLTDRAMIDALLRAQDAMRAAMDSPDVSHRAVLDAVSARDRALNALLRRLSVRPVAPTGERAA